MKETKRVRTWWQYEQKRNKASQREERKDKKSEEWLDVADGRICEAVEQLRVQ